MQHLPSFSDPNLLVGAEHFSDAGVYRLAQGPPELAIVQSVDFFPPLVDDPYTFGRIAAANALSDIYVMGAVPKTALNLVCFPDDHLSVDILQEILRGGAERVQAAGAVILGGHSVRDNEIKYGLAVTGIVDPALMLTNRGARAGDALVLTKALGTGYITTANRAGKCPEDVLEAAVEGMIRLNDAVAAAAVELGAHACTDITGFGLGGHARELADASGVTLEIELARLPILPGAKEICQRGFVTRANAETKSYLGSTMRFEGRPDETLSAFLFDPQTSGGFLIAVVEERADELIGRLHQSGHNAAGRIGRVLQRGDVSITVK